METLTILPFTTSVTEIPTLNIGKIIAPTNYPSTDENVSFYPADGVIGRDGCAYDGTLTTLYQCRNLAKIEIPASVLTIGNNAFDNCTLTTSVIFQDSNAPVAVGESFKNLHLSELYLGRSWTYTGEGALNTTITGVTLGSEVTAVPSNAFNGCQGLTSIVLLASVNSIGENAPTPHSPCVTGRYCARTSGHHTASTPISCWLTSYGCRT